MGKFEKMKKKLRGAGMRVGMVATVSGLVVSLLVTGAFAAISPDGTVNTLTYNAKNQVTDGTYAEPNPPDDDHGFAGWATTKAKADAGQVDFQATPNDATNAYLNAISSGVKRVYAVYKEKSYVYYAVSPYGIGVDEIADDADGSNKRTPSNTITFGPATGNMFSDYTNYTDSNYNGYSSVSGKYNPLLNAHKISSSTYLINDGCVSSSATATGTETKSDGTLEATGTSIPKGRTTVTKDMTKADMDAVQPEGEAALTDPNTHVIQGDDAGTTAKGNPYRCIHYDNWKTIKYWIKTDPAVYMKCVTNRCSKRVVLRNMGNSDNYAADGKLKWNATSAPSGDGYTYIGHSYWDNGRVTTLNSSGNGYNASLIRAKLVGSDSKTNDDANFCNGHAKDYTESNSYLSGFPKEMRDMMVRKKAEYNYNNEVTYDKLFLFSYDEMNFNNNSGTSVIYPRFVSASPASNYYGARGAGSWFGLRSAYNSSYVFSAGDHGDWGSYFASVGLVVSPGFTVSA